MKKVLILVTLLVAVTGCFGKKKDPEKKPTDKNVVEVKEKGVIENKEYSGIKIENIKFVYDGKYTTMSFVLINSRSEAITLGRYDVIVKDAKDEELGKLESYSADEIQPNESLEISLSLDKDFSKATSADFNFITLNQTQ